MLKQHASLFRKLMIAADMFLICLSFFGAYWFLTAAHKRLYGIEEYLFILPLIVVLWTAFLYIFGLYASFRTKSLLNIVFIISKSLGASFLVLSAFLYLFKATEVSRIFLSSVFLIITGVLVLEKVVLMLIFRNLRKKGFNFRNVIVVGTGDRARRFIRNLNQNREFGLRIVGILDQDSGKVGQDVEGVKVIGELKDLEKILRDEVIDQVFFIVPRNWIGHIEESVLQCELVGVRVSVAIDLFNLRFSRITEGGIFGTPLITFEPTSDRIGTLVVKRVIDFVLSAVALIILSPLFLVIAAAVKMTSKGPVLFKQERVGLNGRKFTILKFRTMVKDAEAQQEALMDKNEMRGPAFKIKDDPRITPLGKILRRTSLDELPQLWNVFVGNMSIVGPRPPLTSEVVKYDHWQRRRLSMRPGITCLWQIKGRNNIVDFDEWMRLDLQYIDNWSLELDVRIFLQTIPVVLFGVGAK